MTDLKIYCAVTNNVGKDFHLAKTLRLTSTFTLSKMLCNGWHFYRIFNEFVYEIAFDSIQLRLRCRKENGNLYLSHVYIYAINELTGLAYDEDMISNFELSIYDYSKQIALRNRIDELTPAHVYRRFILV